MKEFIKRMFGWLQVSNRRLHAFCGFAAFMIMMIFQVSLMSFVEGACPSIPEIALQRIMVLFALTAVFVTFMLMCAVEFTQQRAKVGVWDWLDISSGILPAIVTATLIILVVMLT